MGVTINLVHQDLKSPNVLVEGSGKELRLTIADFGLSKVKSPEGSIGVEGGTIRWMAPELLSGRERSSYASDVWALGIIFWGIVSCRIPFETLSDSAVVWAITSGVRDEIPYDAPRVLSDIIQRCWAGRSERRPTASRIEEEIAAVNGGPKYT